MSEPDAGPSDPPPGSSPSAAITGLWAAALGVLVTSLPQLTDQINAWTRALLALIAVCLGLSVFAVVQARREAPRRRLWGIVAVAGGAVSVCVALALGANTLFSKVTTAPVKVGFVDKFTLESQGDEEIRVGSLPLDPGSYVIWAKLYVVGPDAEGVRLSCRLEAANDYDITSTDVARQGSAPLTLTVAHTYESPGVVLLNCHHRAPKPLTSTLQQVKIVAVGADSVGFHVFTP